MYLYSWHIYDICCLLIGQLLFSRHIYMGFPMRVWYLLYMETYFYKCMGLWVKMFRIFLNLAFKTDFLWKVSLKILNKADYK